MLDHSHEPISQHRQTSTIFSASYGISQQTQIAMDWYSWLSKTTLEPSLIYEYGLAFSRNELQKEDLAYFNHEFLQSMGISVAKHRLEILKLARKEVGEPPNGLSKLILAINKTRKRFNKYVNKLVHHEHNAIKPFPEPVRYQDQWRGGLTRKCKSEKEVNIEQPVPRTRKCKSEKEVNIDQAVQRTRKCKSEKEVNIDQAVPRTRKIAKSGPLDYRGQENLKLLAPPRSLKFSGPLDRKMQEKLMFSYRSPVTSGPIDMAIAQERLMLTTNRSPKLSAPLTYVRPPSPKFHGDYNKEKTCGDYGDQTLWADMFQDMKPT